MWLCSGLGTIESGPRTITYENLLLWKPFRKIMRDAYVSEVYEI